MIPAARRTRMEKREERRNVSSRDIDGAEKTKYSGGEKKDVKVMCACFCR